MIISIVSANGGTGKTTSAANIGISLAKMGKKTILIDNNTGFRNLDIALGLESVFAYDISDVFGNKSKTDDVIVECNEENLFLVPASLSGNSDEFNEEIHLSHLPLALWSPIYYMGTKAQKQARPRSLPINRCKR